MRTNLLLTNKLMKIKRKSLFLALTCMLKSLLCLLKIRLYLLVQLGTTLFFITNLIKKSMPLYVLFVVCSQILQNGQLVICSKLGLMVLVYLADKKLVLPLLAVCIMSQSFFYWMTLYLLLTLLLVNNYGSSSFKVTAVIAT